MTKQCPLKYCFEAARASQLQNDAHTGMYLDVGGI